MAPGRDFVVMGTDGLFDNLYDKDVESCLHPNVRLLTNSTDKKKEEKGSESSTDPQFELVDPEGVANCMAKKAYGLSKERRYMSPFA